MNIEARKVELIKQFLNIENENLIEKLEELLREFAIENYESNLKPMTIEQLEEEIDISIAQEERGEYISAKELNEKIKKWK